MSAIICIFKVSWAWRARWCCRMCWRSWREMWGYHARLYNVWTMYEMASPKVLRSSAEVSKKVLARHRMQESSIWALWTRSMPPRTRRRRMSRPYSDSKFSPKRMKGPNYLNIRIIQKLNCFLFIDWWLFSQFICANIWSKISQRSN